MLERRKRARRKGDLSTTPRLCEEARGEIKSNYRTMCTEYAGGSCLGCCALGHCEREIGKERGGGRGRKLLSVIECERASEGGSERANERGIEGMKEADRKRGRGDERGRRGSNREEPHIRVCGHVASDPVPELGHFASDTIEEFGSW
eukprot:266110-Rhodomonas_salina.2